MARSPTRVQESVTARWLCNTVELSGELSVGDVVSVGEVALAVGRPAGWTPVSGGLNEARTDEHGTHPLPAAGPGAALGDETASGDQRQEGTTR